MRAAMARLAPGAEVAAIDAQSGVPAQPWGERETRLGAIARARAAIGAAGAELGVGLEGGVIAEDVSLELVSWVAVVDRHGRLGLSSGLRFTLPAAAAQRLRAGEELGDVIDDLFGTRDSKRDAGAVGTLTEGFVSRSEAFADLVAMACAPFLFPELYG